MLAQRLSFVMLCLCIHVAVGDYAEYAAFLKQQATNATFVRLFEEHLKEFEDNSNDVATKFPCKQFPRQSSTTTSVHKLTPADVKVIAAMGDSITAGTGIKALTPLGLLWENRGLSWSVGGDGDISRYETLPNFLKVYDPSIRGFSTGGGFYFLPNAHLNVAVPGHKSEDMPAQARRLVSRMKSESKIDFENDWKLITLFIGGNDLCAFCKDQAKYSAGNYVGHIQEALDILHAEVPRAFVNLVEVLDVSPLKALNTGIVCRILHQFLCKCGAYPANDQAEADLKQASKDYQAATRNLAESGRYDTKDDFTVVSQPFFRETTPPTKEGTDQPDLSYFAPDCFHLSRKGHVAAAEALWDNMIEPVGAKKTKWSIGTPVECPTAQAPYFYTYKKSEQSGNYGDSYQGDALQQESQPDQTTPETSGNAAPGVIIALSCLVALVTIASLVAWRRTRRRSDERVVFLSPKRKRGTYEEI